MPSGGGASVATHPGYPPYRSVAAPSRPASSAHPTQQPRKRFEVPAYDRPSAALTLLRPALSPLALVWDVRDVTTPSRRFPPVLPCPTLRSVLEPRRVVQHRSSPRDGAWR